MANLWTAFSNLTPQTILQWEFFLGLGDEKKEKIPAHTNSCSRLLKLPAEAVYHKYRKKRTSKTNISSYLSRSCTTVIDDRFSNTGHTGSPASVAPLTSRPWTPHPEIPEGVPRANRPFLSPVPTSTKSHKLENLTSHLPSVPFGHGLGL